MGISWELVGSCMGVTGLAEKRKEQGWLNSERIPKTFRMYSEWIFCFANNLFWGNVRTFSQKNSIFAI